MPTTQRNNIVALKLNEYDVITICVVDTLTNYSPNKGLSFPDLTYACVLLLALDSMQRVQTLVAININDITVLDNSILIPIISLIKQSTVRRHSFTMCLKYFL